MPRFGEAHELLSATHLDTEPPAAGADPADGQVATWSDALKAWIAADPAGGVTDHGLLTGLADDDHPHYALADKSRPDPWVAAADLSARSIADLGTKAHDLLDGLADDDHPHYALADKSRPDPWVAAADLAGRSIADLGTKAHDLLDGLGDDDHPHYALADKSRPDPWISPGDLAVIQSASGLTKVDTEETPGEEKVRIDVAGIERLVLQNTTPEFTLVGQLRVGGQVALGSSNPSPNATYELYVVGAKTGGSLIGVAPFPSLTKNADSVGYCIGSMGVARMNLEGYSNTGSYGLVGLVFEVRVADTVGGSALNIMGAMLLQQRNYVTWGKACAITDSYFIKTALQAMSPNHSVTVANPHGLWIPNFTEASMHAAATVRAIRVEDQLYGDTIYLLELGPPVPYMRLLGGSDPAADESNLLLKLETTLKLVSQGAVDSGGAGFRVLRVPN